MVSVPAAPVARDLAPLPSFPPTASPVASRGATAVCVTCAAAGPTIIMAGRASSNSRVPVLPVADAMAGAVDLDCRAIANAWVPVGPVVGGAVGAVVVRPRAIFNSWELVSLVDGVCRTFAVGDVGLGGRVFSARYLLIGFSWTGIGASFAYFVRPTTPLSIGASIGSLRCGTKHVTGVFGLGLGGFRCIPYYLASRLADPRPAWGLGAIWT